MKVPHNKRRRLPVQQPLFADPGEIVLPSNKYRRIKAITDQGTTQAMWNVMQKSRAGELIARWREEDRLATGRHAGGRELSLDHAQALVLMAIVTRLGHPPQIRNCASLLLYGMDDLSLWTIGLDRSWFDGVTLEAIEKRIERALHSILEPSEPFPRATHKHKIRKVGVARSAIGGADSEFVDKRIERLLDLNNAILAASFYLLPRWMRKAWNGDTVVDSTFVGVYGKRMWSTDPTADAPWEEQAGIYQRKGEHGIDQATLDKLRPAQAKKLLARLGARHGYEATLISTAPADPTRRNPLPTILLGWNLGAPGTRPGFHATSIAQRIAAAGIPIGFILGDMAYGPVRKPEDYVLKLRELGIRVTANLHERDRGMHFRSRGATFLEDRLYCPAIEAHPELMTANLDYLGQTELRNQPGHPSGQIDHRTWAARNDERAKFEAKPNGRVATDGSIRATCPAMGPNPTVVCPLRARPDAERLIVDGVYMLGPNEIPAEQDRGSLCCNRAGDVTFRDAKVVRHFADIPFASRDFRTRFPTYRNIIESTNNQVKDPNRVNLENGRTRRMRGFAAVSLMITFQLLAFNLSKIEAFEPPPTEADGRPDLKPPPVPCQWPVGLPCGRSRDVLVGGHVMSLLVAS